MRKRILSLILSVLMIASSLTVVPASAETHETTLIRVVSDVKNPSPGDTINFTIIMGPVSDLGTIQMVLDIPEGLTYVENSGRLADNLEETLGFDVINWTESSRMLNGGALYDYNSDTETVLGYFQCTVDEGFKRSALVGLKNLEFYSCETWEDHTERFSVLSSFVSVLLEDAYPNIILETPVSEDHKKKDSTYAKPVVFYDVDDLTCIEIGIPINDVIGNKGLYIDETGKVADYKETVSIGGVDFELSKKVTFINKYTDHIFDIEPITIYSCAKKLIELSGDSLKNADVIGDDGVITTADAMVVNSLAKNENEL